MGMSVCNESFGQIQSFWLNSTFLVIIIEVMHSENLGKIFAENRARSDLLCLLRGTLLPNMCLKFHIFEVQF